MGAAASGEQTCNALSGHSLSGGFLPMSTAVASDPSPARGLTAIDKAELDVDSLRLTALPSGGWASIGEGCAVRAFWSTLFGGDPALPNVVICRQWMIFHSRPPAYSLEGPKVLVPLFVSFFVGLSPGSHSELQGVPDQVR